MEFSYTDGKAVLSGDLFIQDAEELTTQLSQLLEKTESLIQFDLGRVEAVDTAALQIIIAFLKSAQHTQKKLEFINLSDPLKAALKITGLDAFFGEE